MNCLKILQFIVTLLTMFRGCFCQNCNLDQLEHILQYPTRAGTFNRLEENPFQLDLLNKIKASYCEDDSWAYMKEMLEKLPNSCTADDKAPYHMLTDTAETVCEINPATTCLNSTNVQYEFAQCFDVLQRNFQYIDQEVNGHLICCSYELVSNCVQVSQADNCSGRNSRTLILQLLAARINPWTVRLGCTE